VGNYHVRYEGPDSIRLTFNSVLDGPLFQGDHPIRVSIVDGKGRSFDPSGLDQAVGTLARGDELSLKVTYDWQPAADNTYQGREGRLLMWLVAEGIGGGRPPGGGGGETEPPVTTGRIVVRVLGDPMGGGELVPLPGASVRLAGIAATTDEYGQVAVEGLTFGEYTVTVTAANPVTGTDPQTGSGTARITPEAPEGYITILLTWSPPAASGPPEEPEEPTEEPVQPPEEPAPPERAQGSVTVRVLDVSARNQGAARPIEGAIVHVGPAAGRTDASGEIRFDNLPLARYIAYAEAVDPANPESGVRKSGTLEVHLTPEQPDQTVTIMLAWSDAFTAGATTPGAIKGRICAPRAPGARIWATNEAGQVAAVAVAAINRLGVWLDYLIPDLPPGPWTLTLQYPDEQPVSQSVVVRPGEVTQASDFTLACTGDGAPRPSVVGYLLAGIVLLVAGIRLRQTA